MKQEVHPRSRKCAHSVGKKELRELETFRARVKILSVVSHIYNSRAREVEPWVSLASLARLTGSRPLGDLCLKIVNHAIGVTSDLNTHRRVGMRLNTQGIRTATHRSTEGSLLCRLRW